MKKLRSDLIFHFRFHSGRRRTSNEVEYWADATRRNLDPQSWNEFKGWFADPRNGIAFLRQRAADRSRKRRRLTVRVASTAALCVTFVLLFLSGHLDYRISAPWLTHSHSIRTAIGAQRQITLPDGSSIFLNTNTEVSYSISPQRRLVVLSEGEALFNVSRDRERPFVVYTGSVAIQALGTEFSAYTHDNHELEVLVRDGTVVTTPRTTHTSSRSANTYIRSGDAAKIETDGTVRVTQVGSVEIDRRLAWIHGLLSLTDESLEQAVEQLNRYRVCKIRIGDAQTARLRVGGLFSVNHGDDFIDALSHMHQLSVTHRQSASHEEVWISRKQVPIR